MQKMNIPSFHTAYSLKYAAIQKLVRLKMELSKISKVARFTLNSTIILEYYSPTASSEEAITTLKLRKSKIRRNYGSDTES
jgi:hypothetical protein